MTVLPSLEALLALTARRGETQHPANAKLNSANSTPQTPAEAGPLSGGRPPRAPGSAPLALFGLIVLHSLLICGIIVAVLAVLAITSGFNRI